MVSKEVMLSEISDSNVSFDGETLSVSIQIKSNRICAKNGNGTHYEIPSSEIYSSLFAQKDLFLTEIRWEEAEQMLLKFEHSVDNTENVKVFLGRCDKLVYGDFQISFSIETSKAIKLFEEPLTVSRLVKAANPAPSELAIYRSIFEKQQNEDSVKETEFGEFCLIVDDSTDRNIKSPHEISLESICFDPQRLTNFFDCNLDDSIDFFLTYGNNDLVNAMKQGEDKLKEYITKTPVVYLDEESEQIYDLVSDAECSKTLPEVIGYLHENCSQQLLQYNYVLNNPNSALKHFLKVKNSKQYEKDFEKAREKIMKLEEARKVDLADFQRLYKAYFECVIDDWQYEKNTFKNINEAFTYLTFVAVSRSIASVKCKAVKTEVLSIKRRGVDILDVPEAILSTLGRFIGVENVKSRYRNYLVLFTVLEKAIKCYRNHQYIASALHFLYRNFTHHATFFLERELKSYALNHSATELQRKWDGMSKPFDFYYSRSEKYRAVTPPESHQKLVEEILAEKAEGKNMRGRKEGKNV